jgi:transposase
MTAGKPYVDVLANYVRERADILELALTEEDRAAVIKAGQQGNYKRWRQGLAIDMSGLEISRREISKLIGISPNTLRRVMADYQKKGFIGLFEHNSKNTETAKQKESRLKTKRILEILHRKPNSFGINRTSWTQPLIAKIYESTHGQKIGNSTVGHLVRKSGYSLRKARIVLTSPDPEYEEKVEALLTIVHSLQEDEALFFIDEFGPRAVKRYGGRLYLKKGETANVPKKQSPKGSVTLSAALNATTNQLFWIYGDAKDTEAMIDLIEILYSKFFQKMKIYITWDAASWHASLELINWLDAMNTETLRLGNGPYIEFVPLPISSQFLNVIESVFSSMVRAVIHHSDYGSAEEMKTAISKHFADRNEFFKKNPRRAGKKIWEIDFFHDFNNLRSGDYREW